MHFHHSTSSLSVNENIDLVGGKYFPAHRNTTIPPFGDIKPVQKKVRIFVNVYGVFGNITDRLATRLDHLEVKCNDNCIVKSDFIVDKYEIKVIEEIADEEDFWIGVECYPWFRILIERFFVLSKGNMNFIMDWDGSKQLSSRVDWFRMKFGSTLMNNLCIIGDNIRPLLVGNNRDILIDCNLDHGESWVKAGGSFFYWPEIHKDCPHIIDILHKRFILLERTVKSLEVL